MPQKIKKNKEIMEEDQTTSDTALTDAMYRIFNQRGNTALEKARESNTAKLQR